MNNFTWEASRSGGAWFLMLPVPIILYFSTLFLILKSTDPSVPVVAFVPFIPVILYLAVLFYLETLSNNNRIRGRVYDDMQAPAPDLYRITRAPTSPQPIDPRVENVMDEIVSTIREAANTIGVLKKRIDGLESEVEMLKQTKASRTKNSITSDMTVD